MGVGAKDGASKLFDFSPAQMRQEDSSHSPAAASELAQIYEDWGWNNSPSSEPCIDLLGTAGAVRDAWSCGGKTFTKVDDEAPKGWDECLRTNLPLQKKIQLSGPEGFYQHFPLLGIAHSALFKGKYGVGSADADDLSEINLRRQVSSKRQARLLEKGSMLKKKCERARQTFFSDGENRKDTDKRTWNAPNGPAGAYTNYFNAYVDPVMFML